MTRLVRFAPALGDWIADHLAQGVAPSALIETMQEREMAPAVARAIVAAFLEAQRSGLPRPVDAIEIEDDSKVHIDDGGPASSGYRTQPLRLATGHLIDAGDRQVRVALRLERPALAVLAGVLDADECAELITLARPRLEPSTVVDPQSGHDVVAATRGSFGMFFRARETPFIERLEERLARLMNVPLAHGEGLQVLHYPQGAGSAPHFDFLLPSHAANRASIARSGQRTATLVAYLNHVPSGGETLFPAVGLAVAPQRGHAVHFEYCNRFGELDHASVHASHAVEQGEKWVATKWVRERPFVAAGAMA
jgi:prolyl 4-hydroxylase